MIVAGHSGAPQQQICCSTTTILHIILQHMVWLPNDWGGSNIVNNIVHNKPQNVCISLSNWQWLHSTHVTWHERCQMAPDELSLLMKFRKEMPEFMGHSVRKFFFPTFGINTLRLHDNISLRCSHGP